MGKIIVSDNITLDGVIQDPAGDEGFRLGGWVGQIKETVTSFQSEASYVRSAGLPAQVDILVGAVGTAPSPRSGRMMTR